MVLRVPPPGFTAKRDAGDVLGDDSIKVSSLEGASLSLDVTVSYRISPTEKVASCGGQGVGGGSSTVVIPAG